MTSRKRNILPSDRRDKTLLLSIERQVLNRKYLKEYPIIYQKMLPLCMFDKDDILVDYARFLVNCKSLYDCQSPDIGRSIDPIKMPSIFATHIRTSYTTGTRRSEYMTYRTFQTIQMDEYYQKRMIIFGSEFDNDDNNDNNNNLALPIIYNLLFDQNGKVWDLEDLKQDKINKFLMIEPRPPLPLWKERLYRLMMPHHILDDNGNCNLSSRLLEHSLLNVCRLSYNEEETFVTCDHSIHILRERLRNLQYYVSEKESVPTQLADLVLLLAPINFSLTKCNMKDFILYLLKVCCIWCVIIFQFSLVYLLLNGASDMDVVGTATEIDRGYMHWNHFHIQHHPFDDNSNNNNMTNENNYLNHLLQLPPQCATQYNYTYHNINEMNSTYRNYFEGITNYSLQYNDDLTSKTDSLFDKDNRNLNSNSKTSLSSAYAFENYMKKNVGYSFPASDLTKYGVCLTTKGVQIGTMNCIYSLLLLYAFILFDLHRTFFVDKYHFGRRQYSTHHPMIVILCVLTIIGSLLVNIMVAWTCGVSIVISNMDLVSTISNAIFAFIVLQIDDLLIPILITILKINIGINGEYDEIYETIEGHGKILTMFNVTNFVFKYAFNPKLIPKHDKMPLWLYRVFAILMVLFPLAIVFVPLTSVLVVGLPFLFNICH